MQAKHLLSAVIAATFASAFGAEVRVVASASDKTGEWGSAYTDVNAAVAAAGANGVVLFKNGTYNLTASIELTADAQTLRGESREGVVLNGQNTVRIVNAGTRKNPKIEHLTFRNGCGDSGGAIYFGASYAPTTVSDCDFYDNVATGGTNKKGGGAIYNGNENAGTYSSCRFYNNHIDSTTANHYGGAIFHYNNSNRTKRSVYTDCIFSNNWVKGTWTSGGAVNTPGLATFTRCQFLDNRIYVNSNNGEGGTVSAGGALYDSCTASGSNMHGSSAFGSLFKVGGDTTITNCTFSNITGATGIGFILNQGSAKTLVTHCRFVGITNSAELVMGMYAGADMTVRNCLFAKNSGVTIFHSFEFYTTRGRMENCTIVDNVSSTLFSNYKSNYKGVTTNVVVDTLVQHAAVDSNLWYDDKYELITTNCIFAALPAKATNNVGLVLTAEPVCRSSARGDYTPRKGSAADGAAVPLDWMTDSVDLDGNARLVDGKADIGACQRQADEVDPDYSSRAVASASDKTGIWANAHVGIQEAIDAALEGDTVCVKAGTYLVDSQIAIENRGIDVRGEGVGKTIVDAQGNARCLYVELDSSTRYPAHVSGITFRNGAGGEYTSANLYGHGGCAYISSSHTQMRANVTDCRFTASHSPYRPSVDWNCRGGGVYAKRYSTFTRCLFDNNSVSNSYGAGIFAEGVLYAAAGRGLGPVFTDCIVSNNTIWGTASASGGHGCGAYMTDGSWWEGCEFVDNGSVNSGARYYGGALMQSRNSQVITNCTFHGNYGAYGICSGWKVTHCRLWDNDATGHVSANNPIDNCWFGKVKGGHVVFIQNSAFQPFRNCVFTGSASFWLFQTGSAVTGIVENCTFASQSGTGAIFIQYADAVKYKILARNCIFWNVNRIMSVQTETSDPAIMFENCLLQSYPTCSHSVQSTIVGQNPLFTDLAGGDFTIRRGSPCRDAGLFLSWFTGDTVDMADRPRVVTDGKPLSHFAAAVPDIGAYECQEPPKCFCILMP